MQTTTSLPCWFPAHYWHLQARVPVNCSSFVWFKGGGRGRLLSCGELSSCWRAQEASFNAITAILSSQGTPFNPICFSYYYYYAIVYFHRRVMGFRFLNLTHELLLSYVLFELAKQTLKWYSSQLILGERPVRVPQRRIYLKINIIDNLRKVYHFEGACIFTRHLNNTGSKQRAALQTLWKQRAPRSMLRVRADLQTWRSAVSLVRDNNEMILIVGRQWSDVNLRV